MGGITVIHTVQKNEKQITYFAQFSNLKPATLSNSLILFVTKTTPRLLACEAINISRGPIEIPFFSNPARIFPYSIVAS